MEEDCVDVWLQPNPSAIHSLYHLHDLAFFFFFFFLMVYLCVCVCVLNINAIGVLLCKLLGVLSLMINYFILLFSTSMIVQ